MHTALKLAGSCLLILAFLLFTTNPQTLPSVVLIVPFVLVFWIIFFMLVFIGLSRGMPRAKLVRAGGFGAALPTLLLILQSLGQLTPRDVFTVLVLFCIAYFYMTRITGSAQG